MRLDFLGQMFFKVRFDELEAGIFASPQIEQPFRKTLSYLMSVAFETFVIQLNT